MPTFSKLLRDVAACMAAGYLAVALFHPSVKASSGLVTGGIIAAACIGVLLMTRKSRARSAPEGSAVVPGSPGIGPIGKPGTSS
jgi:hypothetical protein